jgi:hypothetical protein
MIALTGIVFRLAFVMVQFSSVAYSPTAGIMGFARSSMALDRNLCCDLPVCDRRNGLGRIKAGQVRFRF